MGQERARNEGSPRTWNRDYLGAMLMADPDPGTLPPDTSKAGRGLPSEPDEPDED
jgi:hypothetical protein